MRKHRAIALAAMGVCLVMAACSWDPARPFDREAPPVREAISALDAGDAQAAATSLEEYLSTGACEQGNIGAPPFLKKRPNGSFDLGLSLFAIGESFGGRFGEEENDGGAASPQRAAQVECALRVVRAIAEDDEVPIDLRARAHYLEGNLLFLAGRYEEAVSAYNQAIVLAPGQVDAGDPVGRDAAWNRAIALRRIEDKKDAGNDAGNPDSGNPDSGKPDSGNQDAGNDGGKDGGGDGGKNNDKNDKPDGGGNDGGQDASSPPPQQPDAGQPPPPQPQSADQDERILDQLEKAPTVQQEAAKKVQRRAVRGMAAK